MILLLFLFINLTFANYYYNKGPEQVKATKGQFFVHQLHSAYFFQASTKVKWEATLNNKPALPSWLRLLPSRHPEIAYLIGTPVTNVTQVTIHVIAKRIDNFDIQQKSLMISIADNPKYNIQPKYMVELQLDDLDVETFLSNRDKQINQLETAIRSTFSGAGINPIIVNVTPKNNIPKDKEHLFKNEIGTTVYIGTQRQLYPMTLDLVNQLINGRLRCEDPNKIKINKNFRNFKVNWCQIRLINLNDADEQQVKKLVPKIEAHSKDEKTSKEDGPEIPPQEIYGYNGYNFYNSVILFPAIGIICVILLLVLSMIFFGTREGQNWRDYKTSRNTMEEYISVRESQKHLRELSVQRQLISMSNDNSAPTGIHSFLQPRSRAPSTIARFSKSASRLNDREDTVELLPSADHVPVGKQTVAEAAKQCGSSLHLYRNPLDSESDDNSSDSDN